MSNRNHGANREHEILTLVDGYVNGLLSSRDRAFVEQQCEFSPVWRAALAEAQKRDELMRNLPESEASEALIRKTLSGIEDHATKSDRRRRVGMRFVAFGVAASVAIVGVLHVYYLTLAPSPYDLRVFGQTALLANSDASLRVQLFDRDREQGVSGAPVAIGLRNMQSGDVFKLASFKTDTGGSHRTRFRLPDWTDGEYELSVIANVAGKREAITRHIKLTRSWKLMLSTDKPVYQPGQTILCRSLALRKPDLKPIAGHGMTFTITDPKGNVIFKQHDVTSKFGIASIECPLATEIIEGPYTIEATVGETISRLAVEVKKYVLPKFKITLDLDQPYYKPGQTVRGSVQAEYYFGKPVANARVNVKADGVHGISATLAELSVMTEGSGLADFEFTLPSTMPGTEQVSGDASIAISVDVTDPAGQSVAKRIRLRVTTNPIRVEVIAENGSLVRGVSNTIHLLANYADGEPARARLAVTGLDHEILTNSMGVATFNLTPTTDEVGMTIRATDEQGRVGRRHVTLTCGKNTSDFLIRTDKSVYDGGETVDFLTIGYGSQPVFIDFIKDGQTILTETVEMVDGRGAYQLDLPPDIFGTLELVAYRFGAAGLPIRKSRVLFVRQASELTIKSNLDFDEYRPGGKAKLTFTLANGDGQPTPGAISLAAVDEAVFGVLDQLPGLEGRFFMLEQELLEPIYAIYPWSPNLTTSKPTVDRIALENALFTVASNARTRGMSGGRGERIQALLDSGYVTPRTLRVLEDPNLVKLMESVDGSDELAALLHETNQHTLQAISFPAKAREVTRTRHSALRKMKTTWKTLGAALAVCVMIRLCMMSRIWVNIIVVGLILALLVSILLPSLSRAREMSKTVAARASLRSLAQANMTFTSDDKSEAVVPIAGQKPLPVRVRDWFPETLLWRPELITDDNGRVEIDIDLADSITTWRVSASAVTADGSLGGSSAAIRVFQPFFVDLNLPVALTRGDEVTIPVVVYNYLDSAQTVELLLDDAEWFERIDVGQQSVELAAGEVKSVGYRIRVRKVGQYDLKVTARGSGVADAIKRSIEVVSDGQRVERVFNGTLSQPADLEFVLPESAIEGSAKAIVKFYPSSFSQLVEGLDAIFQKPYGCFEQTSSTTYPNVLALDYLRRTGTSVPEVEVKAHQYIHLGYQRLLGFEVDGGGFDWFGRPPANRTLTAYGLMEFEDMAQVREVDLSLIGRTREWLMSQRRIDGSWEPESHKMHVDPTQRGDLATLSTTAYVAWAVYRNSPSRADAAATLDYLLSHRPESIDDPYLLALVCNALFAMDASGGFAQDYVARLDDIKRTSDDLKTIWWEQGKGQRTAFYGSGRSGSIETTALASLALMESGRYTRSVRSALTWLAEQKDSIGTFHTTQATVLGLKALIEGTGRPLADSAERRIELVLNDVPLPTITIPAEQGEVVRQVDLSEQIRVGSQRLALTARGENAAGYQVAFSYHVPSENVSGRDEPLSIDIRYAKSELRVGDSMTAVATIVNNMADRAPMVILDLPIPAGFGIDRTDFDRLVQSNAIAKFQVNPRTVVLYLRGLDPGTPVMFNYELTATMPVKITVPPARVYEYYDPETQGQSQPNALTVREAA